MNIGTIITGVIVLGLLTLPFILANRSKKKYLQELLKSLSEMADMKRCEITRYEIFNNFIIGIDEIKSIVFFLRKRKDSTIEGFVNLHEISRCQIVHTMITRAGNPNAIDKLALVFTPLDSKKTAIVWELFNAEESFQVDGELQLAKTWEELINKGMS